LPGAALVTPAYMRPEQNMTRGDFLAPSALAQQ
jgi:hypothetical protein